MKRPRPLALLPAAALVRAGDVIHHMLLQSLARRVPATGVTFAGTRDDP